MCGIAGILSFNHHRTATDAIQLMTRAMRHRGPDDEGYLAIHDSGNGLTVYGGDDTPETVFQSNTAYSPTRESSRKIPEETYLMLGHRRLSIIDLSPAGHQPMCTEDERYWIVYNGEIYNFRAIRDELVSLGVAFNSNSDTEVVLKAFRQWGADSLNRFNGMWAFAIWDRRKKKLFCSRDRIGIKPFYYHVCDKYLIFASDIKTLIASKLYSAAPDWEGVYHAMSYQCAPRPMTCFNGVKALSQGHWMAVDLTGHIETKSYWRMPYGNIDHERTETQWIEALDNALNRSVERRLVSDVPVGTYMSGGIDSTTLSVIAAQKHNGIKAFTLSFGERYRDADELPQAKATAAMWPMRHIWKEVNPEIVLSEIDNIVNCYEEPSLSLGPIYVISQLAIENQVPVVLSGIGPDELFGGYGLHSYLSLWRWLKPFRRILSISSGLNDTIQKVSRLADCADIFEYYVNTISIFSEKEKKELFILPEAKSWNSFEILKKQYQLEGKKFSSNLEALSYLDMINYIGNHHLYRGDQFSMHFSIECRYPYLDHEYIELACRVPDRYRVKNGKGKYIQRRISERYIHPSCLNMKKKGFSFPLNYWMKHQIKELVLEKIERLKKRDIFNSSNIDRIMKNFYGKGMNANKLWFLVSTELWLEKLIDSY